MLGRTSSPSLLTSLRAQGVRSVAVSTSGALLAPDFDETDQGTLVDEGEQVALNFIMSKEGGGGCLQNKGA